MRSVLIIVALLGVAFAAHAFDHAPAPAQSAGPVAASTAITQTVLAGLRDAAQNNAEDATAELYKALYDSRFAQLPEELRYKTLFTLGALARQDDDRQAEAHGLLVRATAFVQADGEAWLDRLATAYAINDYVDSAHSLVTIAQHWPDTLNKVADQPVYILDTKLTADKAQTTTRQAMLQALFDARWKDRDGEPSILWRELTSLLLAQGKPAQASTVALRITSARIILSMRVDKRFDAVIQRAPQAFDVDQAMTAELAAARAEVASHPDQLRPLTTLQTLLLDTCQFEQVLAVSDDAVATVRAGKGKSTYADFEDRYVWVLDQRARALMRLGQWDAAGEQWAVAARRPEQGAMNVSQIINLGDYYANRMQPARALDTVSELGSMSPYGRMNLELVKLKAAMEQHDHPAVDRHLAYMRAHNTDAMDIWQQALLVSGDLDGATDLLVQRLQDDAWRNSALVDMQHYAKVRMTPLYIKVNRRWDKIIARPAVQKILKQVGRIESFHLGPDQT